MPLPLLLAIVMAFGLPSPGESSPLTDSDLRTRLLRAGCGVAGVGLVAAFFGVASFARSWRKGRGSSVARRLLEWGRKAGVVAGLTLFGWTLWGLDWPRVVDWGLGLRGVALVQELAVLLPFLAGQFLAGCVLYPAEARLRVEVDRRGPLTVLGRRARQAAGIALPVVILYVVGRDLLPSWAARGEIAPGLQLAATCGLAAFIFLLSPLFVRLAWPTRTLEDGPLRERLERLSRRLRFRCTDIRVWDTGSSVVNAGVTGLVPWFRYVLLTDALIDSLSEDEIEAVFSHEVGHIAHRHLPYFALFFLGSTGLLAFGGWLLATYADFDAALERIVPDGSKSEFMSEGLVLVAVGIYFYFAFGLLSRLFERQADVYGCRALSCGEETCPVGDGGHQPRPGPTLVICPSGVRVFADALRSVAVLNGMAIEARSWRHGSIGGRIAFLEGLDGDLDSQARFRRRVALVRWPVGILLIAAAVGALFLSAGP